MKVGDKVKIKSREEIEANPMINESCWIDNMFLRPFRIMYYKHQLKKLKALVGDKV